MWAGAVSLHSVKSIFNGINSGQTCSHAHLLCQSAHLFLFPSFEQSQL